MSNKNSIYNIKQLILFFGLEGLIFQFTMSVNGFGNALYATNMGATNSQIGLLQLVPNLVAFALMMPLGIISDRLKSAKTIPIITLLMMSFGFFMFGTVPAFGELKMIFFFIFLALAAGGIAIYNGQWQAMFGDVTKEDDRNTVYSIRNRFMFAIGIIVPLAVGFFMNSRKTVEGKILVLRLFFYVNGVISLLQAFIVYKLPGGIRSEEQLSQISKFKTKDIADTVKTVMKEKKFLLFFIPVLLFYMTWHLDWSMWYIGQITYCHFNETYLSIFNAVNSIGQLLAIGYVSKLVRKKSPDFMIISGVIAMTLMPVFIVLSAYMPANVSPVVLTIFGFLGNIPQCSIGLCAVQLLLSAAPEKNRALVVSLYTMCITLSNSFIPWLGVQIYTAFGTNLMGFTKYNTFVFIARILTMSLMIWRYRYVKNHGMIRITE